MNKLTFNIVIVLSLALSASVLWGDVVELDNGSKITGQIEKIAEGKIQIKTDFASVLTIDMERVVNLSSDTPMFVALTSGNKLYGTIKRNNEQTQVDTPDGSIVVEKGAIVAAWLKGMSDPLTPPKRKLKYEAGLDVAGKTGNTERLSTGGRIKATLEGPDDRLRFYLRGSYAKEDGDKTDDELIGGIDFERRLADRHLWYARIELENDYIEELDLRTTAGLGYGYYFHNEPRHVLRARVGLMYRHESYSNGYSDSTAGIDFGLHNMHKFDDWGKLITDITYTPSIEDFSDYRFYHESAFEVPLAGSDVWNLQLGVTNDYNSEPVEGNERLDTTYFSRLVLKWD